MASAEALSMSYSAFEADNTICRSLEKGQACEPCQTS